MGGHSFLSKLELESGKRIDPAKKRKFDISIVNETEEQVGLTTSGGN